MTSARAYSWTVRAPREKLEKVNRKERFDPITVLMLNAVKLSHCSAVLHMHNAQIWEVMT